MARCASKSTLDTYLQLTANNYRDRLMITITNEPWMLELPDTVPCPKCRVVLCRHAGCNDFLCTCGHSFQFKSATWPTRKQLQSEMDALAYKAQWHAAFELGTCLRSAIIAGNVSMVQTLVDDHPELLRLGCGSSALFPADVAFQHSRDGCAHVLRAADTAAAPSTAVTAHSLRLREAALFKMCATGIHQAAKYNDTAAVAKYAAKCPEVLAVAYPWETSLVPLQCAVAFGGNDSAALLAELTPLDVVMNHRNPVGRTSVEEAIHSRNIATAKRILVVIRSRLQAAVAHADASAAAYMPGSDFGSAVSDTSSDAGLGEDSDEWSVVGASDVAMAPAASDAGEAGGARVVESFSSFEMVDSEEGYTDDSDDVDGETAADGDSDVDADADADGDADVERRGDPQSWVVVKDKTFEASKPKRSDSWEEAAHRCRVGAAAAAASLATFEATYKLLLPAKPVPYDPWRGLRSAIRSKQDVRLAQLVSGSGSSNGSTSSSSKNGGCYTLFPTRIRHRHLVNADQFSAVIHHDDDDHEWIRSVDAHHYEAMQSAAGAPASQDENLDDCYVPLPTLTYADAIATQLQLRSSSCSRKASETASRKAVGGWDRGWRQYSRTRMGLPKHRYAFSPEHQKQYTDWQGLPAGQHGLAPKHPAPTGQMRNTDAVSPEHHDRFQAWKRWAVDQMAPASTFAQLQSAFLRAHNTAITTMMGRSSESDTTTKAISVGSEAVALFMRARERLNVEPRVAFHGTPAANLPSIYRHGLLVPGTMGIQVAHGSAYGVGIYTGKTPDLSHGFTSGSGKMIVCGVLDTGAPASERMVAASTTAAAAGRGTAAMAGKHATKVAVEGTSEQKRALRRAKQQQKLIAASNTGKGRPKHRSTNNVGKSKWGPKNTARARSHATAIHHHGDAMVITKAEQVIPMFEVDYGATCNYSYGQRIAPPSAGLNAKGLRNVGYTGYRTPETCCDYRHVWNLQRQEKRKRVHNHRSDARAEKLENRQHTTGW